MSLFIQKLFMSFITCATNVDGNNDSSFDLSDSEITNLEKEYSAGKPKMLSLEEINKKMLQSLSEKKHWQETKTNELIDNFIFELHDSMGTNLAFSEKFNEFKFEKEEFLKHTANFLSTNDIIKTIRGNKILLEIVLTKAYIKLKHIEITQITLFGLKNILTTSIIPFGTKEYFEEITAQTNQCTKTMENLLQFISNLKTIKYIL